MNAQNNTQQHQDSSTQQRSQRLADLLRTHYEASRNIRRGVCMLNGGMYEQAQAAFQEASQQGCANRSLPSFLAACLIGNGHLRDATQHFADMVADDETNTHAQIRLALALWAGGNQDEAILSLREAIRCDRENAELHFQLGTLLTSMDRIEEAELRFTQAFTLQKDYAQAYVSLAMCCGVRQAPIEAVKHLKQAQSIRPFDARIGMLLTQAIRAVQQQGLSMSVHANMPIEDHIDDQDGIDLLSRVIEQEPDFVNAFLSIPFDQIDANIFSMLLLTIRVALERQPEHAELHYHCCQVLERLGRSQEAINEGERAITLDQQHTKALIRLAYLYRATNRSQDGASRLEQAIEHGADYADVHVLLGHLYRDCGRLDRARTSYERALAINDNYVEAQQALTSLATQ